MGNDTPEHLFETPAEEPLESLGDRPLECSECKRPIAVWYTEIVGDAITHTMHCSVCPVLQRRLQGMPTGAVEGAKAGEVTSLACGSCGTTLESIRMGHPLGCSTCYDVFADILLKDLLATKRVPQRVAATKKKTSPIHIGRSPGQANQLSPSLQLIALNEALRETLSREDYEQAAWLRDQIKELTEELPDDRQSE